jgi:hypothetical protein
MVLAAVARAEQPAVADKPAVVEKPLLFRDPRNSAALTSREPA